MSNTISVHDDNFHQEVIESDIPVIVDFWAEWCGPCKLLAPHFESLASEYLGKIKFVKVNVDEGKSIASKYNVRGIPTLILFKDGDVERTSVGGVSKLNLKAFIDSNA